MVQGGLCMNFCVMNERLCWLALIGPHSCSPALIRTCHCSFMLISVILLVPFYPHLFIHAQFCWVGPCLCLLPLVWAHFCSFAGLHLSPLICPHLVVLAGPCAHCCLFVPFATCSCSSLFICWSPFVPACLCPLSCAGSCLVVVVPTTGCTCLAFVHACLHLFLCSFGLVCAHVCLSFVSLSNIRLVHT